MIGEEELGADNVIEAIEAYRSRRVGREGQSYCYHSRKQDVSYRDCLKQALLRKYSLTEPLAKFQNITASLPQQPLPKLKRIRKQSSRPTPLHDPDELRRKCIRRVYGLLKASSTLGAQQTAL